MSRRLLAAERDGEPQENHNVVLELRRRLRSGCVVLELRGKQVVLDIQPDRQRRPDLESRPDPGDPSEVGQATRPVTSGSAVRDHPAPEDEVPGRVPSGWSEPHEDPRAGEDYMARRVGARCRVARVSVRPLDFARRVSERAFDGNPISDPHTQPATEDNGRDRKSTRLNSSHGYISYA